MTREELRELWAEFEEHEDRLIGWKRDEYAGGDEDALANFKHGAAATGGTLTPSQYAAVLTVKHVNAIIRQIMQGAYGEGRWVWETREGEGLKQRIADARNYLKLLAGCIEDENRMTAAREYMEMLQAEEGEPE